jgi:hypothetical protein
VTCTGHLGAVPPSGGVVPMSTDLDVALTRRHGVTQGTVASGSP